MSVLFAGVPVPDIESGRAWYERLFGRPPDLVPHDREVAWQVSGDGWVYVVEDAARAGNALVAVIVDDLDAELAGLAERGLAPGPTGTLGSGVLNSEIADPFGNKVSFGQVPS
jgi:hypothetical protein